MQSIYEFIKSHGVTVSNSSHITDYINKDVFANIIRYRIFTDIISTVEEYAEEIPENMVKRVIPNNDHQEDTVYCRFGADYTPFITFFVPKDIIYVLNIENDSCTVKSPVLVMPNRALQNWMTTPVECRWFKFNEDDSAALMDMFHKEFGTGI